ncbi:hypothetical protein MGYG_06023 [Nannizzia gypsea CBS 118893]|uniref:Uncharacterized protein n=1 Tax=Arthroderma gypseum (strain ATCC MYA-4604 / CBS 118893) TaxID=535722 RepID=E4V086_ARTGP|nr:hypothetical protein MGYG_06023 [Nannizzia gypsea CBS 118893]EFR03023.1 hypothetical protein MGYG_06023 [Nannizzia gypsea CBS 118893]
MRSGQEVSRDREQDATAGCPGETQTDRNERSNGTGRTVEEQSDDRTKRSRARDNNKGRKQEKEEEGKEADQGKLKNRGSVVDWRWIRKGMAKVKRRRRVGAEGSRGSDGQEEDSHWTTAGHSVTTPQTTRQCRI